MKRRFRPLRRQPGAIFRRIYLVVFLLIALLGLLFTGVACSGGDRAHAASTQLLNKECGRAHCKIYFSIMAAEGFDRPKGRTPFFTRRWVIQPQRGRFTSWIQPGGSFIFMGIPLRSGAGRCLRRSLQAYISSGGFVISMVPIQGIRIIRRYFSAAAVEGERWGRAR